MIITEEKSVSERCKDIFTLVIFHVYINMGADEFKNCSRGEIEGQRLYFVLTEHYVIFEDFLHLR